MQASSNIGRNYVFPITLREERGNTWSVRRLGERTTIRTNGSDTYLNQLAGGAASTTNSSISLAAQAHRDEAAAWEGEDDEEDDDDDGDYTDFYKRLGM